MELFFHGLSYRATLTDVERAFASVLHSPQYLPHSHQPWNFRVYLFPPRRNQPQRNHRGCGMVTLPQVFLGELLLHDPQTLASLSVAGRTIKVERSTRAPPRSAAIDKLRREPYVPPETRQHRAAIQESFQNTVGIHTLQLGWETRSGIFSVEWEKRLLGPGECNLAFSDTRREMRIRIMDQQDVCSIGILWSQISWSATAYGDEGHPAITLFLFSSPTFDIENSGQIRVRSPEKRQRQVLLYPDDADFIRVLPYATLCIRLLCHGGGDLGVFRRLCKTARLHAPRDFAYHAEHLGLFSEARLEQLRQWIEGLEWSVAFQLEALLRGRLADTKEILSIRGIIEDMLAREGIDYTASFLNFVATEAALEIQGSEEEAFKTSIQRYARDFHWTPPSRPWNPRDGVFECLHVSLSPTSTKLGGPYPERSNRIMRTYADNQDAFIRVSFVEETDLQYRHDREIDSPAFIRRWVPPILKNGLTIAGRRFHFLAYSLSALKSHTVWFVRERFIDPNGDLITAATIIERLGTFHDLDYDNLLIYCPARYGARISQAFTATDSSVSVPAEEIIIQEDINRGQYCFTDGVGSISPSLARKIWKALRKRGSRSTRRAITYPRAFQIRLVGAKGMLSVEPKLSGDVVVLRHSMIKFDAPHSTDVEIAQAFVRPSKYYLNRPLIMILEGLGIPYQVFEALQEEVVQDVNDAVESLEKAASTLDQFGLAVSYRLSSTLHHLAKLGISPSDMDDFYHQMLTVSIHHILRDLKHHARIPVKDGYTLVGVADVSGYLQEGEVFACATIPERNSIHYLEGPVLISRSPSIHPGDVQVVRAIGRPPEESPFAIEPLMNTLVFSVNGSTPFFIFNSHAFTDLVQAPDLYRPVWVAAI
jgi:RNA-dependent RNA polymerase